MGPEFVAGMIPYLPAAAGEEAILHLHVIDPDTESMALIDRLRAVHGARIAFSLEREPLSTTITYFACSRFHVMPTLLDRYRAPILSFDIDMVPRRSIEPLFEAGRPFDFCCFRTERKEPVSVYQASLMYWPDRPATRTMLDKLQHFAWAELHSPARTSWMLDQAGLFSLLSDPASRVKFGDHRQLVGYPLDAAVRIAVSEELKAELRNRGR